VHKKESKVELNWTKPCATKVCWRRTLTVPTS